MDDLSKKIDELTKATDEMRQTLQETSKNSASCYAAGATGMLGVPARTLARMGNLGFDEDGDTLKQRAQRRANMGSVAESGCGGGGLIVCVGAEG